MRRLFDVLRLIIQLKAALPAAAWSSKRDVTVARLVCGLAVTALYLGADPTACILAVAFCIRRLS